MLLSVERKARLGLVEINENSRIKNIYKIRREWKDTCGKLYWCKRESRFSVTTELWNTFVGSVWRTAFFRIEGRYCTGGIFTILGGKKRRELKKYLGKFFRSIFPPHCNCHITTPFVLTTGLWVGTAATSKNTKKKTRQKTVWDLLGPHLSLLCEISVLPQAGEMEWGSPVSFLQALILK